MWYHAEGVASKGCGLLFGLLQVTYDIMGFMDKNKDLLFTDLSKAMYACERTLLKQLFPEGSELYLGSIEQRDICLNFREFRGTIFKETINNRSSIQDICWGTHEKSSLKNSKLHSLH